MQRGSEVVLLGLTALHYFFALVGVDKLFDFFVLILKSVGVFPSRHKSQELRIKISLHR